MSQKISLMWKGILKILNSFRIPLFVFLYLWFIDYAWIEVQSLTALPATRWMNIFNFGPFSEWENVITYFRDLRTGVPPVLSAMEVLSFYYSESLLWVTEEFYRICIILMLVLPVFLTRGRWVELIWCLLIGWLFLEAILIIGRMNPQLYDIVLPTFILLFLLFSRISFRTTSSKWLTISMAFLAGLFLSMAELARPFMLMLVPIMVIYHFYNYRKVVLAKQPSADQNLSNRKDAKGRTQRPQRFSLSAFFAKLFASLRLNLEKVLKNTQSCLDTLPGVLIPHYHLLRRLASQTPHLQQRSNCLVQP